MRFRWSSVDGRKRCKNASVDEKPFIRFQETENGGFRKCISVDRALRFVFWEMFNSQLLYFIHLLEILTILDQRGAVSLTQ